MVYQVIALKHRPQRFADVVAQDHIILPLKNAVVTGKIHHGYLFTGPRGTGKTTTARLLSKALNCENLRDGEPCNECVSCKEISAGVSPNVIEIDAASNRGIDDIRQLRESIRYSPIGASYKIYIIDEVHQLTSEAFNALLKTLEEPPAHGIFILATTEPQKVPATIMSRCLRFDFRLVPLPVLIDTVESICRLEGIETERDAVEAICIKADGSVRDAFSLTDQVISTGLKKIDAATTADILGLVDKSMLVGISAAISSSKPLDAISIFNDFVRQGGNIEYFVDSLNRHIRDLFVIKVNPDDRAAGTGADFAGEYREIADRLDEGQILRMLNITAELFAGLRRKTVDPIVAVELALIKMAGLDRTVSIDRLLKMDSHSAGPAADQVIDMFNPSDTESTAGQPKIESAQKKPRFAAQPVPVSVPPSELTIDAVREKWQAFIQEVNKKRRTLWANLNGSLPVSLEGNLLTLKTAHNGIAGVANMPQNLKVIESLTERIFGKVLRFEYKVVDRVKQTDAGMPKGVRSGRAQNDKKKVDEERLPGPSGDEIVDQILEDWGGRLVNYESFNENEET
jgi:DNA polymerase-3 subunit gamma/tau